MEPVGAFLLRLEPHIQTLVALDLFFAKEEWAPLRRPSALAMAQVRLNAVAAVLADRDYPEKQFSIAYAGP